jgi:hypothetical protein
MPVLVPAQNYTHIGAGGGRLSQAPLPTAAQNPITTNPMFGRPGWTYISIQQGPVRGPQPRLARGSGRTGDPSLPGNAAMLPGYLSDNEYLPTLFTYDPVDKPGRLLRPPKTINVGTDGRDEVGTYKPHDFTPGQRFLHHMRQAANWQVMEFPPNYRQLLQWQQVRKYQINSFTLQARPLAASDYFLGYQINPQVAAAIGQSTFGNLGSK